MREIKFRAWDKEQKCMWYGGYVVFGMPLQTDVTDLHQTKIGKYPRGDSALMQFTGIFDKNGKEIYEGDVLRCNSSDDDWNDSVTFNDGAFQLDKWTPQGAHVYPRLLEVLSDAEVIGNIYENPELLK